MKKILLYTTLFSLLFTACRKSDENLDVDLNKYPLDTHASNSEIDKWITDNFTNPWNIQVIYRFDRFYTDINRNIAPISLDKIQPSLKMVTDGFINPYVKLQGEDFGKIYFPKQWILFGSGSYNTDGSYVLGTMSNARTLTLYDLNILTAGNGENIRRRLRTVHHEFMHSLNQTVPIPPAFQAISGVDYEPNWTSRSEATVRPLGFVSPYAGSQYTEDFAEMLAHIVVEGPVWYNNYLLQAGTSGAAKLKSKEAFIYSYLMGNFNIDLYALQAEVQKQMKTIYGVTDPADISLGFSYRLFANKVNTITYNHTAAHYTTYGSSTAFNTMYTNYRNSLAAAGRNVSTIQFIFSNDSTMVFRVNSTNATSGAAVVGDYNFKMKVDPISGLTVFTKQLPEATGTNYTAGATTQMLPSFETYILPYLTNRQFIAAYLPAGITATDPLYRTFAGFSVSGTPANYFYGPVTYK